MYYIMLSWAGVTVISSKENAFAVDKIMKLSIIYVLQYRKFVKT